MESCRTDLFEKFSKSRLDLNFSRNLLSNGISCNFKQSSGSQHKFKQSHAFYQNLNSVALHYCHNLFHEIAWIIAWKILLPFSASRGINSGNFKESHGLFWQCITINGDEVSIGSAQCSNVSIVYITSPTALLYSMCSVWVQKATETQFTLKSICIICR